MSAAEHPAQLMKVQVVYAAEQEQVMVSLDLAAGATLGDAIEASGLCQRYGLTDEYLAGRTGIHGRVRPPQEPLSDGDRVEIYRPLLADPKDARRRRARVRPR